LQVHTAIIWHPDIHSIYDWISKESFTCQVGKFFCYQIAKTKVYKEVRACFNVETVFIFPLSKFASNETWE